MNKEDYSKYYIQGSDHYLIPKDVFNELFDEMVNWRKESKKQKEVIDKVLEDIKEYKELNYSKYYENEIEIELIDKILKVLGDD